MAFPYILAESESWLRGADDDGANTGAADRAAAQLRRDYERWSRWARGLVAFVAAALAVFVLTVLADMALHAGRMIREPGSAVPLIAMIPVTAGVVVLALRELARLWRSGRALTRAAASWIRAPYVHHGRHRRAGGWVLARTTPLEPPLLVRIITGAWALLLGVLGIAAFFWGIASGEGVAATVGSGVVGLLSSACGLGQIGGPLRIATGMSEGDPLWHRLRSALSR